MKARMMTHACVLAALTSFDQVTGALLQPWGLWDLLAPKKKKKRRKCDLSPVNIKQVKPWKKGPSSSIWELHKHTRAWQMIFCLIYYAASREDLQRCFVPGCCVPTLWASTSHRSAALELITAALIQTHQIRFGPSRDKSPQPEPTWNTTTGCYAQPSLQPIGAQSASRS